jgi:hypothetical protein
MKYAIILLFWSLVHDITFGTIIANTFGPGDATSLSNAARVGLTDFTTRNVVVQAAPFVVPRESAHRLEAIDIAILATRINENNTFVLEVLNDVQGVPGSALERFSFSPSGIGATQIVHFTSRNQPMLNAGERYWLVGSAPVDANGQRGTFGWSLNSQGIVTDRAYRINDGPWIITPPGEDHVMTYRVEATSIPEPASRQLLLIALAATWRTRRKLLILRSA